MSTTPPGSRILSLSVLFCLALGLYAIYWFMGRETSSGPAAPASRPAAPSSLDRSYTAQAQPMATPAAPPANPPGFIPHTPAPPPPLAAAPPPDRLPPAYPARVPRAPALVQPSPSLADPVLERLNRKESDPAQDLRIVMNVFQRFLNQFGAYPAGDNAQMTRALTGNNPSSETFLPKNSPAINADGEMTDRWGTPLFFHMIARDQIEIRTAGPDKKMYTPDDLLEKSPSLQGKPEGSGVQL
jgi:hypothetical protein